MNRIDAVVDSWEFNRQRTLATLDDIGKRDNAIAILGWRPGPGRAHIAWQLVHVAVTEELFATERLLGTTPGFSDLLSRFRGGSVPDDQIPEIDRIRDVLDNSRRNLLNTISTFTESDLETIPDNLKERGWSIGTVLNVLAWHEPHHQGQAHITLNLWKAANST